MADKNNFNNQLVARSQVLQLAYNSRILMRDVENGLDTIEAKKRYINKSSKLEQDDSYLNRLSNSIFYNVTNRMIKINYNRMFGKEATISSDDEFLNSLQENFDGYGNSLTEYARKRMKTAMYDSQSHSISDLPFNKNGKFDTSIRPTTFKLDNDQILNVRIGENNEVIHLRYFTYFEAPDPKNIFEVVHKRKVYVFDKIDGVVYYDIYEEDSDQFYNTTVENAGTESEQRKVYPLDFIPINIYYPEETETPFYPEIIFKDLAQKNIEYFRSSSDQTNILHTARAPILFLKNVKIDGNGIAFGTSVALSAESEEGEEADAKWLEINGNSINAGRQNMNDIVAQMESLGFELMTKKSGISATSATIDSAQNASLLTAYAVKLQAALRKEVKVLIELKKKTGYKFKTEEFNLNIDTKFSLTVDQAELQFMQFLRSTNDISGKVITDYAKSLGYLSSDFNYEKDQDSILDEGIGGNESFVNSLKSE